MTQSLVLHDRVAMVARFQSSPRFPDAIRLQARAYRAMAGGSTCGMSRLGLRDYQGSQPKGAGVAKLVNAETPQISGRKPLRVRIPPPAPPLAGC